MTAPPKRRWHQFSLRSFLAFITVVAALLGLTILPAERQRAAVRKVEGLGGSVDYGDYRFGQAEARKDEFWVIRQLREWLPRDYFDPVVSVRLTNKPATDSDIQHLRAFKQLDVLFLDGTEVTDAGLVHVAKLPKLSALSLYRTRITSAGLTHINNLPALASLRLEGTTIKGDGLAPLQRLPKLQYLYLNDMPLTDDDLATLQGLPLLRTLTLAGKQVTDASAAKLQSALPNCRISR